MHYRVSLCNLLKTINVSHICVSIAILYHKKKTNTTPEWQNYTLTVLYCFNLFKYGPHFSLSTVSPTCSNSNTQSQRQAKPSATHYNNTTHFLQNVIEKRNNSTCTNHTSLAHYKNWATIRFLKNNKNYFTEMKLNSGTDLSRICYNNVPDSVASFKIKVEKNSLW